MVAVLEELSAEPGDTGLSHSQGKSEALFVTSGRALIRKRFAEVNRSGGTYRPTAEVRADVVVVSCGDSDIGEQFNCAGVVVRTKGGQRATPLSYRSGPQTHRNSFGATWVTREVYATYAIASLKRGFTVAYTDDGGASWEIEVEPDEVRDILLLGLPEVRPLTIAERIAAEREAARREKEAELAAATKELEALEAELSKRCLEEARAGRINSACKPAKEMCAALAEKDLRLPGCPHTSLELTADALLPRGSSKPVLVFACSAGRLGVTLRPHVPLLPGSEHPVRLRWQQGPYGPVQAWQLAGDNQSVSRSEDREILQGLMAGKRLAIQVTPADGTPFSAEFKLREEHLEQSMTYLDRLCVTP